MKKDLTKTVQEDANELLKLMGSTATASVLEDSENARVRHEGGARDTAERGQRNECVLERG